MTLLVRHLSTQAYEPIWHAMQHFTQERDKNTDDEIWCLQHQPVFTQGQAGKAEHLLKPGNIPVVQVDRGGQVTYHGPGQLVCYLLLDLRRLGFGARELVTRIENALINVLKHYDIDAQNKADAPGVYVDGAKIAALGLRIRRACSFHGLSLNIDMDLSPFSAINPCGYQNLAITHMKTLNPEATLQTVEEQLATELIKQLNYHSVTHTTALYSYD